MKLIFFILFYFSAFYVQAGPPPCSTWQVLVKEHSVNQYTKNDGTTVNKHLRKTFCREKWKNADYWEKMLVNTRPEKWPNSSEQFLKWSTKEKIIILKLLASMPSYFMEDKLNFYRAKRSIISDNPATTSIHPPQIVIYDTFYKNPNKLEVIVHELAHLKYESLSTNDKIEFMSLSGWSFGEIDYTRKKVELIPPPKTVKSDSVIGLDEDFANYIEVYVANPNKLKKLTKIYMTFLNKGLLHEKYNITGFLFHFI